MDKPLSRIMAMALILVLLMCNEKDVVVAEQGELFIKYTVTSKCS